MSDLSGRDELYVRPFPGPGGAIQISTNSGEEPVWSRDGRELFYREGDVVKSVTVSAAADGAFTAGVPVTLFEGRYERTPYGGYAANDDVSLEGQQFLVVRRKNVAATNRRDAQGVAATLLEDADVLLPEKPRLAGLDAIRRNEEEFYETPFTEWRATIERIRISAGRCRRRGPRASTHRQQLPAGGGTQRLITDVEQKAAR